MSDTLTEGQQLVPGESLVSKNGAYTLTLQDDGNLVLASRGTPLWASATNGQQVVRAEVQRDGNFVVYTADKPVWHTDTKGKKNVRLVLQDDRNLVLYAADGPAWSTHTETDAPPPPEPTAPTRRGRSHCLGYGSARRHHPGGRRGSGRRTGATGACCRARAADLHRGLR